MDKRRYGWRRALATPILWWLLSIGPLWIQSPLADVLGLPDTSSPRATFAGFLTLTDQLVEHYVAYQAAPSPSTQRSLLRTLERGRYLMDLSDVAPAAQHEIATATVIWFWEVIARVELPAREDIPEATAYATGGALADQPPKWRLPGTGIVIQRVEQGARAGEFLFSSESIAAARSYAMAARAFPYLRPPRMSDVSDLTGTVLGFSGWMLPPRWVEQLPEWMRHPIAGQVVWKWGLSLVSVILTLMLLVVILRRILRRPWDTRFTTLLRYLSAPLMMLAAMQLWRYFLDNQVQVTGVVTAWPDYLAEFTTRLALIWTILILARWVPGALVAASGSDARDLNPSLIQWMARVVALLAIAGLLFSAAQDLGIPVYGLVAGAGVGGLVMALAARPTLENFLGALSLFADRPIRVGDLCRFDERHGQGWNPVGIVEAIGLRSTKIRQFDRSLITIPNADLAERNIVNLSVCDKFLLQQRFALRFETSDDQLRYLLAKLRELLHAHPKTIHTPDYPIRARFLGFRDQALTLELRAYIRTTSYSDFLAIQEDIMLRVLKQVRDAGTDFGLPASTLYMARDTGIDADSRAAAETCVRDWVAAHELPFPDLDEAQRTRLTGTLDYPPRGSLQDRLHRP